MAVLEARGVFWWAEETVRNGKAIPAYSAAGLLTIDSDGRTSVVIDGTLSPDKKQLFQRAEPEPEKRIVGTLVGTGQYVILMGLRTDGFRLRSHGMDEERYLARAALISRQYEHVYQNDLLQAPQSTTYSVSLSDFEDWFDLSAVLVDKAEDSAVTATYSPSLPYGYDLADGKLAITSHLQSPAVSGHVRVFSMTATGLARFDFPEPIDLTDVRAHHLTFQDFLSLLTSADHALDWPLVTLASGACWRLYFATFRKRLGEGGMPRNEPIQIFAQLRDRFGALWDLWREKNKTFGASFNLYLATRRSLPLYAEHKFLNYVWTIEVLHRLKNAPAPTNMRDHKQEPATPLGKKVQRIINQIAEPKDRKWLEAKLAHAAEPLLEERIFSILSGLGISLEKSQLRLFSKNCAALRNDLSHHGGRKTNLSVLEYMAALEVLCPLVLLRELDFSEAVINAWMFQGVPGRRNTHRLAAVGLLAGTS